MGLRDRPALQTAATLGLRTKLRGRDLVTLRGWGKRGEFCGAEDVSCGVRFCAEPTGKKRNNEEGTTGGSFGELGTPGGFRRTLVVSSNPLCSPIRVEQQAPCFWRGCRRLCRWSVASLQPGSGKYSGPWVLNRNANVIRAVCLQWHRYLENATEQVRSTLRPASCQLASDSWLSSRFQPILTDSFRGKGCSPVAETEGGL